jgi:hypothetical protein
VTFVADDEVDPELVDALLRWQRGRGPRPAIPGDRNELLALLGAVVDSAEVTTPPIDQDPVARRLGLAGPADDSLAVSLRELAHRYGGELDLEEVPSAGPAGDGTRVRAVGRTLAELFVVVSIEGDDLAGALERAVLVFAQRPATTAVVVVSARTHLAVVVSPADCVTSIDPLSGWSEPALPQEPEPFAIAVGRHLERTRPRWDEIAHLDEMLVFAPDPDDVAATIERVITDRLRRPVRIPARRAALAALDELDSAAVVAVVDEVRAGGLGGDELLDRIRVLAGVGTS